jgi:hypothetical protein
MATILVAILFWQRQRIGFKQDFAGTYKTHP